MSVRYAVLSDIHGNAEALESVLASLAGMDVQGAVCLGDIVGYGADPSGSIASVRRWSEATVMGNHDRAVVNRREADSFNEWAHDAVVWTREQLTEEELAFLRGLPLTATYQGAVLAHASPRRPGAWNYILDEGLARGAFDSFDQQLCLIGHSHEPCFFEMDGEEVRMLPPGTLTMASGRRYLANAGSVGQPRDGDPRASYAVVDLERSTVEIVRVEYDVETAGRKIERAGLPVVLAERLVRGA